MLAPPVGSVVHVQEAVPPLVLLKAMSDTVAKYPADLHVSAIPDPDSDKPAQRYKTVSFEDITIPHVTDKISWLNFKQ